MVDILDHSIEGDDAEEKCAQLLAAAVKMILVDHGRFQQLLISILSLRVMGSDQLDAVIKQLESSLRDPVTVDYLIVSHMTSLAKVIVYLQLFIVTRILSLITSDL